MLTVEVGHGEFERDLMWEWVSPPGDVSRKAPNPFGSRRRRDGELKRQKRLAGPAVAGDAVVCIGV
jgi:hypothetical protein